MNDQRREQGEQHQPRYRPNPGEDRSRMGNKPGQRPDQGKVGQDTDGDGKVVQPGHRSGLSHGTGEIKK